MPLCPLQSVVLLFSLLSARPSSRNHLILILILVGDYIRLQLRPFDLAVLGNLAFTLFTRQASKGNCACGRLPIATGWILSSLFYPLFLLRLSNLANSTCRSPQPKPSASCATLLLLYLLKLCQQTRNCSKFLSHGLGQHTAMMKVGCAGG